MSAVNSVIRLFWFRWRWCKRTSRGEWLLLPWHSCSALLVHPVVIGAIFTIPCPQTPETQMGIKKKKRVHVLQTFQPGQLICERHSSEWNGLDIFVALIKRSHVGLSWDFVPYIQQFTDWNNFLTSGSTFTWLREILFSPCGGTRKKHQHMKWKRPKLVYGMQRYACLSCMCQCDCTLFVFLTGWSFLTVLSSVSHKELLLDFNLCVHKWGEGGASFAKPIKQAIMDLQVTWGTVCPLFK